MLVVVTAYALIRISVGSTFIACILTIVGYSVNDTIVIFDRIRENLHGIKKYSADELADIANESLTQTLSRSINTSLTTFVMVLLHRYRAVVCYEALSGQERHQKAGGCTG